MCASGSWHCRLLLSRSPCRHFGSRQPLRNCLFTLSSPGQPFRNRHFELSSPRQPLRNRLFALSGPRQPARLCFRAHPDDRQSPKSNLYSISGQTAKSGFHQEEVFCTEEFFPKGQYYHTKELLIQQPLLCTEECFIKKQLHPEELFLPKEKFLREKYTAF